MAASSSDAQGPVWFWGMDGTPEQVLNQWYPCKFEDEDKIEYSSTEEYMMYHKAILFGDKETAQRILGRWFVLSSTGFNASAFVRVYTFMMSPF